MKTRLFLTLAALLFAMGVHAQNDTLAQERATESPKKFTKQDYIPKFTATVLGRYEYNPLQNAHHFELRHTRIGVMGSVHPMFSYLALVDLTFGGAFSPVAIFAQFKPVKGLTLAIGYDKMPFSSENLLSPYQYYFCDKSFLTQKLTAWSDVGGTVTYHWDKGVPFTITAGVFNSAGFSKQMQFQKTLNYVARGTFELFPDFKLSLNYAAVKPEAVRIHNCEVELEYDIAQLHLQAEYIYRWYEAKVCAPTSAFYGFAHYKFPIQKRFLDHVALSARYDAITPNTNGKLDDSGRYTINPYCQRITAGISLIFTEKPLRAGIRLNYEKYFYHAGVQHLDDRLILELFTHI